MTECLHHIGFVVPSIAEVMEGFCRAVGGKGWSETWHDPVQGVRVAFIYPGWPGNPLYELVEPSSQNSPVQTFLDARGGIHHVCYEVDNLDKAVREAHVRGLVLVRRPQPAVAFAGRRIAWFCTRETLLIEYLEEAA